MCQTWVDTMKSMQAETEQHGQRHAEWLADIDRQHARNVADDDASAVSVTITAEAVAIHDAKAASVAAAHSAKPIPYHAAAAANPFYAVDAAITAAVTTATAAAAVTDDFAAAGATSDNAAAAAADAVSDATATKATTVMPDSTAAVPDDTADVWPYAISQYLAGYGATTDTVGDAAATASAARARDVVKDTDVSAAAQTIAAITTTSQQISEIDKQFLYLKDDMPATVKMLELQISQVISVLQSLNTAIHP